MPTSAVEDHFKKNFPKAPGMLIIRKISADDADQFHLLRIKALTTDTDIFVATMEEETAQTKEDIQKRLTFNHTLGAFVEEQLVGMLMLMEQPLSKFKHIGILGSMYVDPSYRKLGIGKKLLTQMLQDLKNLPQFEALQLKVLTTNSAAIKLYESFGFTRWASEEKALKHEGKYFDQHHYQIWLR